jgi:hypothetical protein
VYYQLIPNNLFFKYNLTRIAFGKKESQPPVKKKVILSTGKTVEHERIKKEDSEEKGLLIYLL